MSATMLDARVQVMQPYQPSVIKPTSPGGTARKLTLISSKLSEKLSLGTAGPRHKMISESRSFSGIWNSSSAFCAVVAPRLLYSILNN